jgi:hypothetical protein
MTRIASRELYELEELLEEIQSWSDEEVDQLPKFYREKAERYRELANEGER